MLNNEFIGVKTYLSEHFVVKTDFFETQNLVMSLFRMFVAVYKLLHFCLAITVYVL